MVIADSELLAPGVHSGLLFQFPKPWNFIGNQIEVFLIVRLMNQLYKNFIIHRQLKRRFCHAYSADNEAPHLLDSNCLTNGVLFKRDDNGAFICNVIQTTLTYAISTEHEAVS